MKQPAERQILNVRRQCVRHARGYAVGSSIGWFTDRIARVIDHIRIVTRGASEGIDGSSHVDDLRINGRRVPDGATVKHDLIDRARRASRVEVDKSNLLFGPVYDQNKVVYGVGAQGKEHARALYAC